MHKTKEVPGADRSERGGESFIKVACHLPKFDREGSINQQRKGSTLNT